VKHIEKLIRHVEGLSFELEKSKVIEAKVEIKMNEAELKVSKIEDKLLEAEANYLAKTSKVKNLVEEQTRTKEREKTIFTSRSSTNVKTNSS
ncbi:unnamed protein product, partial [Ilex paraguariensis]